MTLNWGPGFRFFECDQCGHKWKDRSRDYTSPSIDMCPDSQNCDGIGVYMGGEHHPEWPTDKFGNLIEEDENG